MCQGALAHLRTLGESPAPPVAEIDPTLVTLALGDWGSPPVAQLTVGH